MMPASLRRMLRRHERALRQGADAERRKRPDALHVEAISGGDGPAERLAASVSRITALLDHQAPLHRVAWEMGAAAHLVADLSNPFRTAPRDKGIVPFEGPFLAYMQEQLPNLRIVFTSYGDPLLDAHRVTDFGRQLATSSRSYLDDLVGGFRRFDETGDAAYLDQRSVPFGITSLSYSRSVTDTARVWLYAWQQAHGDLSGLPYPLTPQVEQMDEAGTKGKP
jgi:hypothetical protein